MKNGLENALLIDISGKQKYIFSSNKLKDNIGASHIISHEVFSISLFQQFGIAQGQIGYIGGGNALLLFQSIADRKQFISEYSRRILIDYPGIALNFGILDGFDANHWGQDLSSEIIGAGGQLIKSANQNRNLHFTHCRPFKTGIETDCPLSGASQEVYDNGERIWVSSESKTKREHNLTAKKEFENSYRSLLGDKFVLTDRIDELTADTEKGYIAVVHIDGNGLGEQFRKIKDLDSLRNKSTDVKNKLSASLKKLIAHTISLFSPEDATSSDPDAPFPQGTDAALVLTKKDGRYVLPIRSIVNAGDDITFVCHGRLGIYLAHKYISILKENQDGCSIPSCAGIAIVHTKYPFYRAYKLAEDLAHEAKKVSRKKDSTKPEGCWIQYFISSGGYTGDIESLLADHYGDSAKGPYRADSSSNDDPSSFGWLATELRRLYFGDKKDKWPRNKLEELRQLLTENDPNTLRYFCLHMQSRGMDQVNHQDLIKYPYTDMIELINFYPKELLDYAQI